MVDFGVWLEQRLQAAGIPSQAELARRIGEKPSTVSRWASRQYEPGYGDVKKLAAALDVSRLEVYQALGHLPPDLDTLSSEVAELWETANEEERDMIIRMSRAILRDKLPGSSGQSGDGK